MMRRPEAPWDEAKALQRRSLSATGREIGRAIIEALLFLFEMIQHDPRCQPKQCDSGYNYLFEKVVVHGFSRISCSVCRESTPKTILTGIQPNDMNQFTSSVYFEGRGKLRWRAMPLSRI
jgi:hypothetical protein